MKDGLKRIIDKGYIAPMQVVEQARTMDSALVDKGDGKHYLLKFTSPVAVIDHPNGNSHYFSSKLYDNRVFHNDEVSNRIKNGHLTGQLGHPEGDEKRKEENISHVFDKLYSQKLDDGLTYAYAEGRVLDTPKGRTLYALYKGGVNVGFSVCGYGDSLIKDGIEFIDEDEFYLEGYDAVLTPSVGHAFPDSIIYKDDLNKSISSVKDEALREEVRKILDEFLKKEEGRGCVVKDKKVKDSIDKGVIDGIKERFANSGIEQTFEAFKSWMEKEYPHMIDEVEEIWAGKVDIEDARKDGTPPDGTGPHGRGAGPGKGKGDGTGMGKPGTKKKKPAKADNKKEDALTRDQVDDLLKELVSIKIRMNEGMNDYSGKTFKTVEEAERFFRSLSKPDVGYDKFDMIIRFKDGELTGFRYDHGMKDPDFEEQLRWYLENNVSIEDSLKDKHKDELEDNPTVVIAELTKDNYKLLSDNQKKDEEIEKLREALKESVMKIALKDRILKDNVQKVIDMEEQVRDTQKKVRTLNKRHKAYKDAHKREKEELLAKISDKELKIKKLNNKVEDSRKRVKDQFRAERELSQRDSQIKTLEFKLRMKDILLELPVSQRSVAETLFQDCKTDKDVDRVLDQIKRQSIIEPTVFRDEVGEGVRKHYGTEEDNLTGYIMGRMSRNKNI